MKLQLAIGAAVAAAVAGTVVTLNATTSTPAARADTVPACAARLILNQPSFVTVAPNSGCLDAYSLITYQQPGNIVHDDEVLTADAAGNAFLPQCSAFTVTYGDQNGIVAQTSGTNTCATPNANACQATLTTNDANPRDAFATVAPNAWCLGTYTFQSYDHTGKLFDQSTLTGDGAGNVFLPFCQDYRLAYGPQNGAPVATLTGTTACAPPKLAPTVISNAVITTTSTTSTTVPAAVRVASKKVPGCSS